MIAAGRHLTAARFAVAFRADRTRRGRGIHGAHRALRHVPRRVGASPEGAVQRAGRHVSVLGRIALAMSTSSIRRLSSGVSRASTRISRSLPGVAEGCGSLVLLVAAVPPVTTGAPTLPVVVADTADSPCPLPRHRNPRTMTSLFCPQ